MDFTLPQASSYAGSIDGLILLITVLAGAWLLLAEGFFFWLIWRFRARDGVRTQYLDGTEPHIKKWISRPHTLILILDVVVIVAAWALILVYVRWANDHYDREVAAIRGGQR